jgi:hypothetical protein
MHALLTPLQKFDLAGHVSEIVGCDADFMAFSECLRDVLEAISGFEIVEPADTLIQEIWSLYK